MTEIKNKNENENLKLILIAFISSLILLFFAFKWYFSELPNRNNIVKIDGVLKENIKTEYGYRQKKTLIIKLQEFPNINFFIGSVSLAQTYSQELLDENKLGDTITIFIERKDYETKILKNEKKLNLDNFIHSENINIVELKNKKTTYLSLTDYDKEHLTNNYLGVALFGIFGICAFFVGIMGIQYHKKNFK